MASVIASETKYFLKDRKTIGDTLTFISNYISPDPDANFWMTFTVTLDGNQFVTTLIITWNYNQGSQSDANKIVIIQVICQQGCKIKIKL